MRDHLREDRTGISLIDDIEVHFLELPKLDVAKATGLSEDEIRSIKF